MSHTRYAPARQRLQRSELAVPGSNPALFEKAAASDVDYVFLDLEDAVAPGDKVQARRNVIEGLRDIDWRGLGKTISVRINGIDTHYMYRDVVDVVEQAGEHLDTILIPKVGVPADVYMVDAMVSQIEEATGLTGKIGIEKQYEGALLGRSGFEQVEIDAHGRTLRTINRNSAVPGHSLSLTLDIDLQRVAREALKDEAYDMLWLRYRDQLSIAEIATALERTNTSVKVMLHRSRKTLARALEAEAAAQAIPARPLNPLGTPMSLLNPC